jgi:hypothetical protein
MLLLVPVPADDSYGAALRWLWGAGEAIVVVEDDIRPTRAQLRGLAACHQPWCGVPYPNTDRYAAWLGCTRFSRSLMRDEPDLLDQACRRAGYGTPAGHWRALANHIHDLLTERGYRQHLHWPPAWHDNPRQQIAEETRRGWCSWPNPNADLHPSSPAPHRPPPELGQR